MIDYGLQALSSCDVFYSRYCTLISQAFDHRAKVTLSFFDGADLKTTFKEIVTRLKESHGNIHTQSNLLLDKHQFRIKKKWESNLSTRNTKNGDEAKFLNWNTSEAKPVPFNLQIYKGTKSWQLPRKFVDFILNHPVAQEFIGIK